MTEPINENFPAEHRARLEQRISSEPDRKKRREILDKARRTLDYKLAKGEKGIKGKGVDYTSVQMREQQELHREAQGLMGEHFVSNEASLYKLFPYVENLSGAVVGVGPDQVLDIFANGETTHAFIVDYTEPISLFTRSLLEVGMYHKKTFGRFPAPEEFVEYFKDENLHQLERVIRKNLTAQETGRVLKLLQEGTDVWLEKDKATRIPVTDYMEFKTTMTNEAGEALSWMGTQANIDKVMQAYEDGRIYVIKGDISNQDLMGKIGRIAKREGVEVNILYWSNVESYLNDKWDVCQSFFQGVRQLPTGNDAVILRTSRDAHTRHPAPQAVKEHPTMSQILRDWHYNAQRYSDWQEKVKRDKTYLRNGWVGEIKNLEESGSIPKTGLTTLGFNLTKNGNKKLCTFCTAITT